MCGIMGALRRVVKRIDQRNKEVLLEEIRNRDCRGTAVSITSDSGPS
jgi:hypothetical protein